MRAVIHHIAAGRGEVHRHAAVLADRQRVEQLLQVGAVVLAVSPGDGRRGTALPMPFLPRLLIRSVERHGRRVVVQFVQADAELADDVPHHGQDHLGPGAGEQPIQAPPQPVVVQERHFIVPQVEKSGGKRAAHSATP